MLQIERRDAVEPMVIIRIDLLLDARGLVIVVEWCGRNASRNMSPTREWISGDQVAKWCAWEGRGLYSRSMPIVIPT